MLVVLLALLAAAEAATVASPVKCVSSKYVMIHSTFEVSDQCRPFNSTTGTSDLLDQLVAFVEVHCDSSTGCTVIDAYDCNKEIHLLIHFECSCAHVQEKVCMRKASIFNRKLQDAIRDDFEAPDDSGTLCATGYEFKLSEDSGTGQSMCSTAQAATAVPARHCSVCEETLNGTYGGFNSSDVNPGEQCQYSICSSDVDRLLVIGFYDAPREVPATIQEGPCSCNGEPILANCSDANKPCLTIVNSSCACVRFETPTCACGRDDLHGKYVAFKRKHLPCVQRTIELPETIEIAKKPDLWPRLADFFANPSFARITKLSIDPTFGPLIHRIPDSILLKCI
jgi:hypothetical protein